ncbi:hypothetical protein [Agreia sp. COWG]|uniref:hypothetical protein n=1 Tax=Agreia sp. COWG TaxID=2773266 RepID=UPI0019280C61|nr:hypothetical protein [Agreia sp. COWG]
MKSLIQQRMALTRPRSMSIAALILGGLLVVLNSIRILHLDSERVPWLAVLSCVVWVAWVVAAIVRLRAANRAIRAFEAEHGRDAGRQSSVT